MRIKSVHLENYLCLLEGTGRDVIDIDFEAAHQAGVDRIMFFARNGAGKSTLLNALTPFPSNGDDRELIVPGRPGRKIIIFDRDGTEIKCDIRWTNKGKANCFMFIDGSEEPLPITAKGNIGEYLDAVKEQLGIDQNYLKIGRVGNRVSGFLEMKPGPRKNFIGQFMPEVEEWAAMHKNVAKRVSMFKQNLQGMQVELDRIEPREELEAAAARAESESNRLREEISRLDTQLGQARGVMSELEPARLSLLSAAGVANVEGGDFNPITAALLKAQTAAASNESRLAALLEERPLLARFVEPGAAVAKIAEVRENIARLNGENAGLTNARSTARAQIDRAITSKDAAELSLSRIQNSGKQLQELEARAVALSEQITSLTASAAEGVEVPDGLTYEEVKSACDLLMNLEGEISDLRNLFPTSEILDRAAAVDMDDSSLLAMASSAQSAARESRTRLDTAKARVVSIETQAQFHSRFAGLHCNDVRCPFEKYIEQFSSAKEELESKKSEIEALEARAANQAADASHLQSARNAAKAVLAASARIRQHRPTFEAAGIWQQVGPVGAFIKLVASTSTEIADVLSVQRILTAISIHRDLSETKRTHAGVLERIESINALAGARVEVEESLARAESDLAAAREQFDSAEAAVREIEAKIKAQANALTLLESLTALQEKVRAGSETVSQLAHYSTQLEALRERWEVTERELQGAAAARAEAEASLRAADQDLSTARLRLGRRDEYEARLAEMQGKLAKAQAVAEACHPAKGAPIEFLRDFLETTRNTVNDLLDVALRGEMRIGFQLSDTEFNIPVSKSSGRVMADVTEASEGQVALAKTVISLALVKQTVQGSGFNIIALDEIDGALDKEKNRERFAEIVDRLSAELGLEQLFMISHNDTFHAAPAGIVLLPGHAMPVSDPSFMGNKILLADYS